MKKTLRDLSQGNFNASESSLEQINCGSFQRIADSLERMEKPYLKLLSDLEYYKKRHSENQKEIEHLKNSNRSLRGVITRMKNKI